MHLKQTLRACFPNIDPARLPSGYDRVGDIAVVGLVPELTEMADEIGAIILGREKNVRVVARRVGHHDGEYRTLPLRVIAGEQRLTTVHRENSIALHLDLAQVYFSVRSAHERARIAALAAPGERAAVLCSGVGPFPLIIGRHSQAAEVLGIEKNPVAHDYALHNLRVNRGLRAVRLLLGDAGHVLPRLDRQFDRILIVLPHGGAALLPGALAKLKAGGMLHFYAMQAKSRPHHAMAEVTSACREAGRHMQLVRTVACGHCGPGVYRVCLDVLVGATM